MGLSETVGKCPVSQNAEEYLKNIPGSGYGDGWFPIFNHFFLEHRCISGKNFVKIRLLTDTPTNSGHCITSLADVMSPYTIYSIQTIDLNFVIAFYAYAGHWAKEASGKAVILSGCGYTWLYASMRLSVSSFFKGQGHGQFPKSTFDVEAHIESINGSPSKTIYLRVADHSVYIASRNLGLVVQRAADGEHHLYGFT